MNDPLAQMITADSIVLLTVMFVLVGRLNRRVRQLELLLAAAMRAAKRESSAREE